jgi:hypothetical protein
MAWPGTAWVSDARRRAVRKRAANGRAAVAVIGPLEVRADDGSPRVISTDRLVETLWDRDPPASARK